MVNSFNEWHEDTQIEPTIVAQRTNIDDSGLQLFTEGHYYEGYSDLYLNILRSATAMAGDFNFDGVVNAADYVVWRKTDGSTVSYNKWRTNFGRTVAGGSISNTTVPEPAAALLLVLAAAFGCGRTIAIRLARSKTRSV
jgi:hypothetical protein